MPIVVSLRFINSAEGEARRLKHSDKLLKIIRDLTPNFKLTINNFVINSEIGADDPYGNPNSGLFSSCYSLFGLSEGSLAWGFCLARIIVARAISRVGDL